MLITVRACPEDRSVVIGALHDHPRKRHRTQPADWLKKIIEHHGGALRLTDADPFAPDARAGAMAIIQLPWLGLEANPPVNPSAGDTLEEKDQS
ncbi:MAG: hypothetical protein U5N55_10920 [Cypionkella sp.]|nr:hypothetical protein [Cypionkella sp.]